MPTLVLLRHAKSAYPEGVDDHDRPLNGRGRKDAGRAGELLAGLAIDLVLVSSARRAQQTWGRVAEFVIDVRPQVRDDLYLASPHELLATVQGLPEGVGTVLVVGHNGGLEEVASLLSGEPTVLKTATFAVLTGDAPWPEWRPGSVHRADVVVARG